MWKNDIDVLALQETHIELDQREERKRYCWYFSGTAKHTKGQRYEAGVGFAINRKIAGCIEDIKPINDRLCSLTLRGTVSINIISTYIPQAGRELSERTSMYDLLEKEYKKCRHDGPTYILGDFNARVQKATKKQIETKYPPNPAQYIFIYIYI